MHHGLAAIHNNPFTVGFAFNARFGETSITNCITHATRERFGLAVRGARRNDHAFKQSGEVLGIEHLNVLRFDIFQTIDDGALKFMNVFFCNSGSSHQLVW